MSGLIRPFSSKKGVVENGIGFVSFQSVCSRIQAEKVDRRNVANFSKVAHSVDFFHAVAVDFTSSSQVVPKL